MSTERPPTWQSGRQSSHRSVGVHPRFCALAAALARSASWGSSAPLGRTRGARGEQHRREVAVDHGEGRRQRDPSRRGRRRRGGRRRPRGRGARRRSASLSRGCSGTVVTPRSSIASSATAVSTRLVARRVTRSPAHTPRARSARPTSRARPSQGAVDPATALATSIRNTSSPRSRAAARSESALIPAGSMSETRRVVVDHPRSCRESVRRPRREARVRTQPRGQRRDAERAREGAARGQRHGAVEEVRHR